ncbi:hypothetical protein BC938DRAFT_470508 [Jimgerdemannia flammicorona]|uniref:BOD1/SHG1 domain-containing protein n=1 Tax=Jimgerdemannia flammicorona TaxID=994334 RepID=A0A433Q9Y6_9FUNG|nr:hypothetical protein BC938DRAFT_470508 [Jimgerdemannia flammicorona]
MNPDEVVMQLKRKGAFDEIRKQVLSDFQKSDLGQQFLDRVTAVLEQATGQDPSLLQRDKASLLMEQLERSDVFEQARQQVLRSFLESEAYTPRIEDEIQAAVGQVDGQATTSDSPQPTLSTSIIITTTTTTITTPPPAAQPITTTPRAPDAAPQPTPSTSTSSTRGRDREREHRRPDRDRDRDWERERERERERDRDRDRDRERGGSSYRPSPVASSSATGREST